MSEATYFDGHQVTVRTWRRTGSPDGPGAGDAQTRTPDRLDLGRLAAFARDPDVIVWVDVVDPAPGDLERLGEAVGLSAFSVEDVLAPHERPKVTRHGADQSFFMTYAVVDGERDMTRVSGFVLPSVFLTFRQDGRMDLSEVTRRVDENADLMVSTGALAYTLLDVIVDGYFTVVEGLDDKVESLEDVLFDEKPTGRGFTKQVYGLRKELVSLRRVALPMREVVNGLLRHHRESGEAHQRGELTERYEDLYDHIMRVSEWTESLRDMITTVFDTNLSLQDARLNIIMRRLTGWAAVIAVPTAISGWFGINVPYPGYGKTSGMWAAVVLTVVCTALVYLRIRRRDGL